MPELPEPFRDVTYAHRAGDVFYDPLAQSLRATCMLPLTGRRPVLDVYSSHRRQWRARLAQLQRAGWGLLTDRQKDRAKGFTKGFMQSAMMRNCPPVGVRAASRSRSCQRPRICPLCYGREVIMETYNGFTWLMTTIPRTEQLVLLATMHSRDYCIEEEGPIRVILGDAISHRWDDMKRIEAAGPEVVGGKIDTVLGPDVSKPGIVKVRTATLAMAHASDACFAPELKTALPNPYRLYPDPTTKEIGKAIAWCMKYPVGMMRGDAVVAIEILHITAAERTRLSVSTGVLKGARAALAKSRVKQRQQVVASAVPVHEPFADDYDDW